MGAAAAASAKAARKRARLSVSKPAPEASTQEVCHRHIQVNTFESSHDFSLAWNIAKA